MALWQNILALILLFIATSFFVVGKDIRRPWVMWVGVIIAVVDALWYFL